MTDSTIEEQAPEKAIADIEKAISSETEEAKQTEEKSVFETLAEKKGFKSADDLATAYENLESKMNPTVSELKELKEMVRGIQESNKPAEEDPFADLPEEQKEAVGLLEKLLDKQLKTKLSPLLKKLEVEEASKKISEVRKQFPDTSDAEIESALSLMEKYPKMDISDAMKITSYERAVSSARKRTEKKQQTKKSFTESASTARAGDDTDYSKLSLKDLEDLLEIPTGRRA
jgi:hypothetical protein